MLKRSNFTGDDLALLCVLVGMAFVAVGAQNPVVLGLALAVGAVAAARIVAHLVGWRR